MVVGVMRDVFAKDIYGKAGFEFVTMTLIAYEQEFLSGFSFNLFVYIQSWTETSDCRVFKLDVLWTCVSAVHRWCLMSLALNRTELNYEIVSIHITTSIQLVYILQLEWSKHMGDTKHEFDGIGPDVQQDLMIYRVKRR